MRKLACVPDACVLCAACCVRVSLWHTHLIAHLGVAALWVRQVGLGGLSVGAWYAMLHNDEPTEFHTRRCSEPVLLAAINAKVLHMMGA